MYFLCEGWIKTNLRKCMFHNVCAHIWLLGNKLISFMGVIRLVSGIILLYLYFYMGVFECLSPPCCRIWNDHQVVLKPWQWFYSAEGRTGLGGGGGGPSKRYSLYVCYVDKLHLASVDLHVQADILYPWACSNLATNVPTRINLSYSFCGKWWFSRLYSK